MANFEKIVNFLILGDIENIFVGRFVNTRNFSKQWKIFGIRGKFLKRRKNLKIVGNFAKSRRFLKILEILMEYRNLDKSAKFRK
jgi:hypothetical protein